MAEQNKDFVTMVREISGKTGAAPIVDTEGNVTNKADTGMYGEIRAKYDSFVVANAKVNKIDETVKTSLKTITDIRDVIDGKLNPQGNSYKTGMYWKIAGTNPDTGTTAEEKGMFKRMEEQMGVLADSSGIVDIVSKDLHGNNVNGSDYTSVTGVTGSRVEAVGKDILSNSSAVREIGTDLLLGADSKVAKVASEYTKVAAVGADILKTGNDYETDMEEDNYSHVRNAAVNANKATAQAELARAWAITDSSKYVDNSTSYSSKVYAEKAHDESVLASAYKEGAVTAEGLAKGYALAAKATSDAMNPTSFNFTTLANGADPIWSYDVANKKLSVALPEGPEGPKGDSFSIGATGTHDQLGNYDNKPAKFSFMSMDGYGPKAEEVGGTNLDGTVTIAAGDTLTYNGTIAAADYAIEITITGRTAGALLVYDDTTLIDTLDTNVVHKITYNFVQGMLKLTGDAAWDGTITTSVKRANNAYMFFKQSNAAGDWSDGSMFGRGATGSKGSRGYTGAGITSIAFQSTTDIGGNAGEVGETDTYKITLDNGTHSTFDVKNGSVYTDTMAWDAIFGVNAANFVVEKVDNKILASHTFIKCQASGSLAAGAVVKIHTYDSVTDRTVVKAIETSTDVVYGMVQDAVADGADTAVVLNGVITGIDTSGFTAGARVYSNGAGAITEVKPTTGYKQSIGYIGKNDASVGEVVVNTSSNIQMDMVDLEAKVGAVSGGVDAAIQAQVLDNYVTAWQGTTDDTHIATEKLVKDTIDAHTGVVTGNPHAVTKTEVGLGNVTDDTQVKLADKVVDMSVVANIVDEKVPSVKAVSDFVGTAIEAALASEMTYKGPHDASAAEPDVASVSTGDTYTVTVAGQVYGVDVAVGDMVIANVAGADDATKWTIVNRNMGETASEILVVPGTGMLATDVQAALDELQSEIITNDNHVVRLDGDDTVVGSIASKVKALADGAVKANTDAIVAINGADTVAGSTDSKLKALADGTIKDNTDRLDVVQNTDATVVGSMAKLDDDLQTKIGTDIATLRDGAVRDNANAIVKLNDADSTVGSVSNKIKTQVLDKQVSAWNADSTDDAVPTEKLVRDSLNSVVSESMSYGGAYNANTNEPRLETVTLVGTVDPEDSSILLGSNTLFQDELVIGDRVKVGSNVRTVVSIDNQEQIHVDTAFTPGPGGQSIYKLPIEFQKGAVFTVETAGVMYGKDLIPGVVMVAKVKDAFAEDDWVYIGSDSVNALNVAINNIAGMTAINVQSGLEEHQGVLNKAILYEGTWNCETNLPRFDKRDMTGTVDPDGSVNLLGDGTLFTTEFVVGDKIEVAGEKRVVAEITDDTHMKVGVAFADSAAGKVITMLPSEKVKKGTMFDVVGTSTLYGRDIAEGAMIVAKTDDPVDGNNWLRTGVGGSNGGATLIDEDDMVSNDEFKAPSQQSVVAYVTSMVAMPMIDGGSASVTAAEQIIIVDGGNA